MLAISLGFPAGRYHATPWGRHVNEADVAWPPDLWRLSRALIAVWYRKVDQDRYPREILRTLLDALASAPPPEIRLPENAIHAHSRHYMPSKGGKRTLIFDAFARVAPDDPIVMAWPSLGLPDRERELLDVLLEGLGYLGRTESWVDARRWDDWNGFKPNCLPGGRELDPETGEILGEVIRLQMPETSVVYRKIREEQLRKAGVKGLEAVKKKDRQLLTTLPEDWLEAVAVDTAALQAAGWSSPPSAKWVAYCRPVDSLKTMSAQPRRATAAKASALITTVRFKLYGKPLPRVEESLAVGEDIRLATMGCAKRLLGPDAVPRELSGHGWEGNSVDGHAFWLPESDERGEIGHALVHVPAGVGLESIRVLSALKFVRRGQGEPLRLVLEGLGKVELFSGESNLAGKSRVWRSVTPYLHPWHLKKSDVRTPEAMRQAILEQIHREWHGRGENLPEVEGLEEQDDVSYGGRRLRAMSFRRFRRKKGLVQPDRIGRFLTLRFNKPVQGPLALGFGCHFGMGLFVPEA